MDNLDYLILSELLKDAALSFVEIAKRVNTTPYTVRRRYEKMKKDGKIQSCVVSIDLSKLGYEGKAFLLITVLPNGDKAQTMAYLKKVKNIILVTEIIGSCDILAIAPITDLESIQTVVKETRKAPYVQRVKMAGVNDINFPVSPNLGAVLSQKSRIRASS
jgi:Lrp/AsnC family transcriptional regulator for asnA, asnC and gidA